MLHSSHRIGRVMRHQMALRRLLSSVSIVEEMTPNENARLYRFSDGRRVLPEEYSTGIAFVEPEDAASISPLVAKLLEDDRVEQVFLGPDWISVNKQGSSGWLEVAKLISATLEDVSGDLVDAEALREEEGGVGEDEGEVSEKEEAILDVIETRVRPAVQADGGDVFYKGFDAARGIVQLQLAGACVGCSHSSETLRDGIERMLQFYVQGIEGVEEVVDTELEKVSQDALEALERKLAQQQSGERG